MRGKDTLGTGSWDTGTLGACRIAEWGLALTAGGSQGTPAHHSPARARGGALQQTHRPQECDGGEEEKVQTVQPASLLTS